MRGRRVESSAAVAIALGAAAVMFHRIGGLTLVGLDTYPEIESSRIRSLADGLGTFTEQTAEGWFPYAFYRPVLNLSLALDYALWDIEPWGYHLSSCLLYAASAVALFALAGRLLGNGAAGRFGRFTTLVAFLVMPVHHEVIPVVSRRMDPLCGLFSTLALWSQLRAGDRDPGRIALLPACFTALALGSKEIGVVLPPLVFGMVLVRGPLRPLPARLRTAFLAALPHGVAVLLVMGARFAALGGLGGHPTTRLTGAVDALPETFAQVLALLSGLAPAGRPVGTTGLVVAGSVGALALGLAAHTAWSPRASEPSDPEPLRDAAKTVAVGLGWILLLASIYGVSGYLQPWYLLVPAQGAALVAGAAGSAAAHALRGARTANAQRVGAVAAALLVAWLGGQARHSPLFGHGTEWQRASERVESYLEELAGRIGEAPPGVRLRAELPPQVIAPDRDSLGPRFVTVLSVYSLPPWAVLALPGVEVEFRHSTLPRREASADAIVVEIAEAAE